jgi:hypothetical protein
MAPVGFCVEIEELGIVHGFVLNVELIGSDGVDAWECIWPSGCLLRPGSNAIPFEGPAPCLGYNEAPQMQAARSHESALRAVKTATNQGYSEADDS